MTVPLLVFGPRSTTYDFGPTHPLTPRRFGPGMDLLRALGAEPGLAPEPASDEDLRLCHSAGYIEGVRRASDLDDDPWGASEIGIGPGDDPPFLGMHDAAASVAGGSMRAMEAILRGDVLHAFHPGGGLHHAMPSRAAGFCVYNDPALAIAVARREGLRVLYVDLDVHHGDGVEVIHATDPGVLTVSFHESGRYLFPGTGRVSDVGDGPAAGSVVNVPFEPETGEAAWLSAVEAILPEVAAAFGPDIVVSQHGCDTHATDPLAHLNVSTTAMGAAARLVDVLAHRHAGGRWLATGGGGYGVYRVVPRAWAHTWLAAAHLPAPGRIPDAWGHRWAEEAARYGDRVLPSTLDDPPNAGVTFDGAQRDAERSSLATAAVARQLAVPALIREAVGRGWWSPIAFAVRDGTGAGDADGPATGQEAPATAQSSVEIVGVADQATFDRLVFLPRLVANLDPTDLRTILRAPDLGVSLAVQGTTVIGVAASAGAEPRAIRALGIAPAARRQGIASRLLAAHVAGFAAAAGSWSALVTVAERDPVEPLDRELRMAIATRLFEGAGFVSGPPEPAIRQADPGARSFTRR